MAYDRLSRRQLLLCLGAGTAASLSGCMGGIGGGNGNSGGNGGSSKLQDEISKIDFASNWKKRRLSSLEEWPYEKRKQIPPSNKQTSVSAWKDTGSVKNATWEPPKGWEDTAAADVDSIQILNYGDMQFDPATAALDAMFETKTGIKIERLEIVVDQAIPKMAATLSSKQGKPQLLQSTASTSMTTYAANGWLEPTDFLMPKKEMWKPYVPLAQNQFMFNDHLWGSPANVEANVAHVRVDMLKEQGISQSRIDALAKGKWSWDDLETIMKAFKGTGIHAWGYRGASLTYTERDWRILWYQTGGQYMQKDGTIAVNADGGGLAALKKMIEWNEKGWVPDAVTTWTQGNMADAFLAGDLAMAPIATDIYGDASKEFELHKQYIMAPHGKANVGPAPTYATWGGGPVLATNNFASIGGKVAGALYQDARYSHEAGWWEYVVESNMTYPTATFDQAAETNAVKFSEVRQHTMEIAKNEVFPQQRAIMQEVSNQLQQALAKQKSPEKALEEAQNFIDTVLGQK